jgi:hypothetical protein
MVEKISGYSVVVHAYGRTLETWASYVVEIYVTGSHRAKSLERFAADVEMHSQMAHSAPDALQVVDSWHSLGSFPGAEAVVPSHSVHTIAVAVSVLQWHAAGNWRLSSLATVEETLDPFDQAIDAFPVVFP